MIYDTLHSRSALQKMKRENMKSPWKSKVTCAWFRIFMFRYNHNGVYQNNVDSTIAIVLGCVTVIFLIWVGCRIFFTV